MPGQLQPISGDPRPPIGFVLAGEPVTAFAGDTVLTAILRIRRDIGRREFVDGRRAGFCVMGACQDCWLETEDGERLRACTTAVRDGMRIAGERQS